MATELVYAQYARSLLGRTAGYTLCYSVGTAWLHRLVRAAGKAILGAESPP